MYTAALPITNNETLNYSSDYDSVGLKRHVCNRKNGANRSNLSKLVNDSSVVNSAKSQTPLVL